jgi:hypothetical protein
MAEQEVIRHTKKVYKMWSSKEPAMAKGKRFFIGNLL